MAGRAGHRGWGHVRKLPSGRFQASYIGPDGNRHRAPMTYGKRADANGWLVDERRALERDHAAGSAEYLAQFRVDIESFVASEVVETAVVPGRYELPPVTGTNQKKKDKAKGKEGKEKDKEKKKKGK